MFFLFRKALLVQWLAVALGLWFFLLPAVVEARLNQGGCRRDFELHVLDVGPLSERQGNVVTSFLNTLGSLKIELSSRYQTEGKASTLFHETLQEADIDEWKLMFKRLAKYFPTVAQSETSSWVSFSQLRQISIFAQLLEEIMSQSNNFHEKDLILVLDIDQLSSNPSSLSSFLDKAMNSCGNDIIVDRSLALIPKDQAQDLFFGLQKYSQRCDLSCGISDILSSVMDSLSCAECDAFEGSFVESFSPVYLEKAGRKEVMKPADFKDWITNLGDLQRCIETKICSLKSKNVQNDYGYEIRFNFLSNQIYQKVINKQHEMEKLLSKENLELITFEDVEEIIAKIDLDELAEDIQLVMVGMQLPLEYSSEERHKNLRLVRDSVENFHILEGYHSNNVEALNKMLIYSGKRDFYISPHYFTDNFFFVNMGMPAITSAYFKMFEWSQERQNQRLYEEDASAEHCLVLLEDDFFLENSEHDMHVLKRECAKLKVLENSRFMLTRLAAWNAIDVYNINRFDEIYEMTANTTLNNPFDDYCLKYQLFFETSDLQSQKLELQSTLWSQRYVKIEDWNECLSYVQDLNIEHPPEQPLCTLESVSKTKFARRQSKSKIRSPYEKNGSIL